MAITGAVAQTPRGAPVPGAAPTEPPLEELVGLFFEVLGAMRQHFTDRSAEFDLTFPQAMALRELDAPLPMGELAERLCCDASNVTGIVDRLEARGLVERHPLPTDRRVKHLVLTDAGRSLRQAHHLRLTDGVPLVKALSPEERTVLADLLRRAVADRLPQAAAGAPAAPA